MKIKKVAILGPTASGKSALAVEIAQKVGANILSLDSLAIYRETDIVSAKPTKEERRGIKHFGIDLLDIDDYFSAATFFDLYHEAVRESEREGKDLIIVGGTGFYLKSMIDGLSAKVSLNQKEREDLETILQDLEHAYRIIEEKDPLYASKIAPTDRYRIGKWHEIYLAKATPATHFFAQNKPEGIVTDMPIFEIAVDRDILRDRIKQRTESMLSEGLIEEVFNLEKKYGRKPDAMKAIGIRETLDYLDGKLSKNALSEQISTHTAQLAKRQETFNNSQFPQRIKLLKDDLTKEISKLFN
jgi:tRNA dimethylallyltransferase